MLNKKKKTRRKKQFCGKTMSITFWLNIHFTPFFLYNILPYFPLHFLTEKLYPLKNSLSSSYSPRSHSVYMISIFYSCCKVLKIKSFPGCKQHKENKSASLKNKSKKKTWTEETHLWNFNHSNVFLYKHFNTFLF